MEEFLKKLAERLGLAEDASEEDILTTLAKSKVSVPEEKPVIVEGVQLKELAEALGMPETSSKEDLLEKAEEFKPKEITRQTQFEAQFPEEAAKLSEVQKQLNKEELARKLDEWHRGGKFGGMPVALDEKIGHIRKALPPSGRAQFDEFVGSLLNTGLVPMREIGSSPKSVFSEGADSFLEAVKEIQDRDHIDYRAAVKKASHEHPHLAEQYRKAARTVSREEVS